MLQSADLLWIVRIKVEFHQFYTSKVFLLVLGSITVQSQINCLTWSHLSLDFLHTTFIIIFGSCKTLFAISNSCEKCYISSSLLWFWPEQSSMTTLMVFFVSSSDSTSTSWVHQQITSLMLGRKQKSFLRKLNLISGYSWYKPILLLFNSLIIKYLIINLWLTLIITNVFLQLLHLSG